MSVVFGVFNENNFRSYCLLKDLSIVLPNLTSYIVFDKIIADRESEFPLDSSVMVIEKEEIFQWINRKFLVDRARIKLISELYPPSLKIFLAIYLNIEIGVDYSVMTDNDIFIYEDIPEIRSLVSSCIPFFIPEVGSSDILNDVVDLVGSSLIRDIFYRTPAVGGGFNVGFCGLDLTVFHDIGESQFNSILNTLENSNIWHREQSFFVLMQFSKRRGKNSTDINRLVHIFKDEKYFFLPYNSSEYRDRSKIFHCIFTKDKSPVDQLYSLRYSSQNAKRYSVILNHLRTVKVNRILEIGVWRGDTSRMMILNSMHDGMAYVGVDLFEDSNDDVISSEVSLRANSIELVSRRLLSYSSNISLYKGFSDQVFSKVKDNEDVFDVIWIDGGHSYATVKFDFENYGKLISDGGVIFFDDYTEDPHLPDVKNFIDKELFWRDDLLVEVHGNFIDEYRGFTYKVVSVRFKIHEARGQDQVRILNP